ncbi:hypothetical protein HZF08_01845 [Paenibacillus sp. CGMCC 1.16610]|uniref:Chemotaxis protein n=1 Tax=Paenibacillus anseongense TaxID=2682845 RepID=A0ABW9U2V0_9BACL|nr:MULTISPECIES: hypothetical protein [Paenibacillus]MBA2937043.1 hypothetical protein [Paenibacillus sp. CGMCC 1.16610]MVQ33366.1 hypothetical protein [Paenibacillus anseongense]
MPIPFILAGAAAIAGVVGIVKGSKSVSNNNEARDLNERSQEVFDNAKEHLERCKIKTTATLTQLGEIKLRSWDEQIGRFIVLARKVTHVNLTGPATTVKYNNQVLIGKEELLEMHGVSMKAKEVVAGGLQSMGAGALAGVASYGGAMMFASASTGTAISALTGVAATNATLAWLGGGSLAAGGLGIAGGAAVLGGIVAGPVLAIGGILMEAKSRKNLAEAKANYAKAKKAVEELNSASSMLTAIADIAEQFSEAILEINDRMTTVLNCFEYALQETETNRKQTFKFKVRHFINRFIGKKEFPMHYRDLSLEHQQLLHLTYTYAQTLKKLLETPLLDKSGSLDDSCVAVLDSSRQLMLES